MNKPELYELINTVQHNGTVEILDAYFSVLKWGAQESVMDIGCGPGNTTYNVIRQRLPKDFKKLVGVDISKEMIEYASKTYSREKCEFRILDVEAETLPGDFIEAFDLIMSFYCMQWVQNQRQAMVNVNKILKPGGRLFCNFPTKHMLHKVYVKHLQENKWSKYMENAHKYICIYQTMDNPEVFIRKLLKDSGFEINICEPKIDIKHDYGNDVLLEKFIASVNPFLDKVPKELRKEYLDDFKKDFLNGSDNYVAHHELVFVYATKK